MAKKIDAAKILRAARSSVPISIKSITLPPETEATIEEILRIFLKEFGQEELKDRLAYCLKELAVNAKKANTKRIFFKEQELNLENDEDYVRGMTDFKEETFNNIEKYMELQKEAGLYVKVVFQAKARVLYISIRNNSKITRKEQMRVYDRIARSRAFNSMEEALTTVLDDSEGAGLGIVILVLMLKKIGLDEDAFDIDIEGEETVATVAVPFSEVHAESLEALSAEIVAEIENLPQFPENIVQLQKMISDPDSEITAIAKHISMDPSLTADLLKVVNSAQFMLPKRVDNIVEAVKLVGLRTLKNLLYSYGTEKLLSNKERWLWDHSYRTAFYAYYLGRSFRRKKDLLDDVYVGGILHDMGKIIFAKAHPQLLEKITNFTKNKDINRNFLEDLSAGLNHAEIGSKIAEKWNFPDSLIESIRYHHEPLSSHPEYKEVVYTVYLANALVNIEEGILQPDQVDKHVLQTFGINSEDQFTMIQERLASAFKSDQNRM